MNEVHAKAEPQQVKQEADTGGKLQCGRCQQAHKPILVVSWNLLLISPGDGVGNVPVSDGLTLLHIAFNLVIFFLFSKNHTIIEC